MKRPLRVEEIEAAYREHSAAFQRVAVALTRDEGLGADAVHDAFVRALRSRRGFRRDAPLVAWLWRIVVNEAQRRRPRPLAVEPDEVEAAADAAGAREDVRARIARLPERQRVVLFLRYYADLDYEAIARTLGIRPGTVASTLHAAHRHLAADLQEVSEWEP